MKNIKYMSLMMALVSVISFGFTSCSNDDKDNTPAPTIVMDEANIEDDIICVKADVTAPGRTAAIQITVTDAAGTTTKVTKDVTDAKYIGVLNIDGFHVHVNIDGKGVAVGDVLRLKVTDANGKSSVAQKSITQEEDDDEDE
jgi:hypothetical protein